VKAEASPRALAATANIRAAVRASGTTADPTMVTVDDDGHVWVEGVYCGVANGWNDVDIVPDEIVGTVEAFDRVRARSGET
jgi:hypothetical protein